MEENFKYDEEVTNRLKKVYTGVIKDIGENPEREGLLKTPERIAKAMQFLTKGYKQNPDEILKSALFQEDYSEMVIVKDIEVYSQWCNRFCYNSKRYNW